MPNLAGANEATQASTDLVGDQSEIGVPTLVILSRGSDRSNFHSYISEILFTEGFPWNVTLDLDEVGLSQFLLERAAVTIVGAIALTDDEIDDLVSYVSRGGRLICMRPVPTLAHRLGVEPADDFRGVFRDGYVDFARSGAFASCVNGRPLQVHGDADFYLADKDPASSVLAWLALRPDVPTQHPAIISREFGAGRVVVYAYDLAASTVAFHQGRPWQASNRPHRDADGDDAYRPNDLFVGHVDPALLDVPQADLHQDALVEILLDLCPTDRTLPRVWHYPNAARAVAFFNGDSDGMSKQDLVDTLAITAPNGVAFTCYMMLADHHAVSPELMAELRQAGNSFGVHAYTGSTTPDIADMRSTLAEEHEAFRSRYGFAPVSYRGHSVVWVGWADMAILLRENGVRLDTSFVAGRFHQRGYLTGSGLPMKFVDEAGDVLDIYEQPTISTDDGWRSDKTLLPALSSEDCIQASIDQIDAAVDEFNTVYHPYFHPICTRPDGLATGPWLRAAIEHCIAREVTFVSDIQWLEFNDARRELRLTESNHSPELAHRTFTIYAPAELNSATLCLPPLPEEWELTIDGRPARTELVHLEGRNQLVAVLDFSSGQSRRFGFRRRGVS